MSHSTAWIVALFGSLWINVHNAHADPDSFPPEIDAQRAEATLSQHLNQFQDCYKKQLALNPDLQGRVVVAFTVTQDRRASKLTVKSSTLRDAKVENCILKVIREITDFPQPGNGASVQLTYPFKFTPKNRKAQ